MKIKLQPGDYVYIRGITREQYLSVLEKFAKAGFIVPQPYDSFKDWDFVGVNFNDICLAHKSQYISFGIYRALTIEQVLNSSQEEDMQEEKYAPKVGEWCEFSNCTTMRWIEICPLYIGTKKLLYEIDDNVNLICIRSSKFRKLKTERDTAIEEMSRIIMDSADGVVNDISLGALFDAGFRRPKQ